MAAIAQGHAIDEDREVPAQSALIVEDITAQARLVGERNG